MSVRSSVVIAIKDSITVPKHIRSILDQLGFKSTKKNNVVFYYVDSVRWYDDSEVTLINEYIDSLEENAALTELNENGNVFSVGYPEDFDIFVDYKLCYPK